MQQVMKQMKWDLCSGAE